jgi:dTDP-4-dehydrorhamnose 3,5-epimerase
MIFKETKLKGSFEIELEKTNDERGFFARSFCKREFTDQGLETSVAQSNISYNKRRATLRGMHYQVHPHSEAKLVSCTSGAMFDVIIDLRRYSPTYMGWLGIKLTAETNSMLYVPEEFAHGFQTLQEDTTVCYNMFEFYHPECARGIRWNDPAFNIKWPFSAPALISEQDQSYEDFNYEASHHYRSNRVHRTTHHQML